jgi:hypothetical protein
MCGSIITNSRSIIVPPTFYSCVAQKQPYLFFKKINLSGQQEGPSHDEHHKIGRKHPTSGYKGRWHRSGSSTHAVGGKESGRAAHVNGGPEALGKGAREHDVCCRLQCRATSWAPILIGGEDRLVKQGILVTRLWVLASMVCISCSLN